MQENSVQSALLSDSDLERSEVAANCRMNRERGLSGSNSYAKDLGFDVAEFLETRLLGGRDVAWLDLCCGSGRALMEAAQRFYMAGESGRLRIVGVDMAGLFTRTDAPLPGLLFVEAALPNWKTVEAFDLITCVHGLHYVGDKLGVVAGAASWLKSDGWFLAHLDPANLRDEDGTELSRAALKVLRASGFTFDTRRRLITREGQCDVTFPFHYLGADDTAGPNYTGQPAVHSHYSFL